MSVVDCISWLLTVIFSSEIADSCGWFLKVADISFQLLMVAGSC